MIKKMIYLSGLFVLSLSTAKAFAATAIEPCLAYPTALTVPISSLDIDIGAPVGSNLTSALTVESRISCAQKNKTVAYFIYPFSGNMSWGASNMTNVLNSPYPGIGIKWRNYNENTSGWRDMTAFNDTTLRRGLALNETKSIIDEFTFIKTGDIAAGIYPSHDIFMYFSIDSSNSQNNGYTANYLIYKVTIPSFEINAKGCVVNNDVVNVDMGVIAASNFKGVGSTSGLKDFALDLYCEADTIVSSTFTANNGVSDFSNGVMNLTADSTATGVGVQVLNQGTPVLFGLANTSVQTTNAGNILVPFTARYYQTESTVTSGTANASMTFKITYQ